MKVKSGKYMGVLDSLDCADYETITLDSEKNERLYKCIDDILKSNEYNHRLGNTTNNMLYDTISALKFITNDIKRCFNDEKLQILLKEYLKECEEQHKTLRDYKRNIISHIKKVSDIIRERFGRTHEDVMTDISDIKNSGVAIKKKNTYEHFEYVKNVCVEHNRNTNQLKEYENMYLSGMLSMLKFIEEKENKRYSKSEKIKFMGHKFAQLLEDIESNYYYNLKVALDYMFNDKSEEN